MTDQQWDKLIESFEVMKYDFSDEQRKESEKKGQIRNDKLKKG